MVAAMRAAQKAYIKERTQQHLRAARALEGDCDREIMRVKTIVNGEGGETW